MQFGDFFFDGDKKKIYEAPVGFSYVLDGNGFRIYTPDDEPSAPIQLLFSTYELWSRYVDYMDAIEWAYRALNISGGAYRYTDQFNEDKYSLIDLRLINDWAYVQADYPHTTFIKGNLFPNESNNVIFDSTRISRQGVIPSVMYSDAGERSVADPETLRIINENSVYASFGGAIWVDPIEGATDLGTDIEPNGNQERPVKTIPLATQIGLERGFDKIMVLNDYDFIAGDVVSNYEIAGKSPLVASIDLGYDAICSKTIFTNINVGGILDGDSEIKHCVTRDLVYFYGHIHNSSLGGTIYLGGSKPAKIDRCSMLDYTHPFILDCGGSGQDCVMNDYVGLMSIQNLTGAAQIGVGINGGHITIDATCTGGEITVMGVFTITDNSGPGCTVNLDGKVALVDDAGLTVDQHAALMATGYQRKHIFFNSEALVNGDGTALSPFSSIDDAKNLAESMGVKELIVTGEFIVPSNLKNFVITGIGKAVIECNGQDLDGSEYKHCDMRGSYIGDIIVQESVLNNGFLLRGSFERCAIVGDLSVAAGAVTLLKNCTSIPVGGAVSSITVLDGLATHISIMEHTGELFFNGLNHADDIGVIDMDSGKLEIGSGCTAGKLGVCGGMKVTNNANGTVVDTAALRSKITAQATWDYII